MIEALHPTPAVCGTPREVAADLIAQAEETPRGLYSGFVGPVGPEGVSLYVNLRTASFSRATVTLWAGGGLLAASEEETEWLETCAKTQTIERILVTTP